MLASHLYSLVDNFVYVHGILFYAFFFSLVFFLRWGLLKDVYIYELLGSGFVYLVPGIDHVFRCVLLFFCYGLSPRGGGFMTACRAAVWLFYRETCLVLVSYYVLDSIR